MASEGFEVTFSELDEVAAAYETEAQVVQQALEQFQSAADLPASAFGNLPQSPTLASQYQQCFGEVVADITKLHDTLKEGAAKLTASAANYRAADRASTIR